MELPIGKAGAKGSRAPSELGSCPARVRTRPWRHDGCGPRKRGRIRTRKRRAHRPLGELRRGLTTRARPTISRACLYDGPASAAGRRPLGPQRICVAVPPRDGQGSAHDLSSSARQPGIGLAPLPRRHPVRVSRLSHRPAAVFLPFVGARRGGWASGIRRCADPGGGRCLSGGGRCAGQRCSPM